MAVDFSLLQPVDIGGQLMQGFQTGRAFVKQIQAENALRAFTKNPDDPEAFNALAAFNPQMAEHMARSRDARAEREAKRQERETMRTLGTQAAGGDVAGASKAALGMGEFDLAGKILELAPDQQKQTAAFFKAAGPLAFKMRQMRDPAERQAFLEASRPILLATGADPAKIDEFDVTNDGALDALIASNRTVDQMIDDGKIDYKVIPEGGSLEPFRGGVYIGNNPQVLRGATAQPPAPAPTAAPASATGPLDLDSATQLGSRFGRVTSTARTPQHNKKVGGVPNSYHLKGKAIDIARAPGVTHAQIADAYKRAGFQIVESLDEGDHSHLAFAGGPSSGPVRVASKAEFDRLPSGARFIAPDGSERRKP